MRLLLIPKCCGERQILTAKTIENQRISQETRIGWQLLGRLRAGTVAVRTY